MKSKLPFVVNYTKEDSEKFNKVLKNPGFYGNWNLLEVGSPEYEKTIKLKRKKI